MNVFFLFLKLILGSARNVTKCSSFYFNGRIRYGTRNEKIEERFLVKKKINN
jgi:hypothetical protein